MNSLLKQSNKESYVNFCLSYHLIDVTKNVAEEYGKLKCALQKSGDIMPENDMWIAAIAIANDMQVVTQVKHFEQINGLSVMNIGDYSFGKPAKITANTYVGKYIYVVGTVAAGTNHNAASNSVDATDATNNTTQAVAK